jgi:hypothetical protein
MAVGQSNDYHRASDDKLFPLDGSLIPVATDDRPSNSLAAPVNAITVGVVR